MSDKPRINVAQYHELTKHRFDGFARGPETIDWDAQPDPFRRFDGAPFDTLPLNADELELPFSSLYADDPIPAQAMGRESIATLLEISLALSAWKQYGGARWSLRCNPSSGNLHPTEAYLIARHIDGLEDGLYHYRADEHVLEQRCRFSNTGETPPTLLLGLSSVHWREAWKYGERAYRYCQLDAGHALAAVCYAATLLGWHITPRYEVSDETLSSLLGIDRRADFTGTEPEHPDLLFSLHATPGTSPDVEQLIQATAHGTWTGQANILDNKHFYDWPVIEEAAEASRRPALSTPSTPHFQAFPYPLPSPCNEPAARLIRRRRSAQAFDGTTVMAQPDFFRLLDHLLPRPGFAPWDSLPWEARIHPVLFVHRVGGLPNGLYALPRRQGALVQLQQAMRQEFQWTKVEGAPDHLPLYHLITARAGRTAATLSCQQAIAGDSAFSLAMLGEFEENIADSPWRYRELHWEAGVLGQVLYLEAEACGLRGTGIGCFFDDGVHELLGIQGKQLQSLYHFTVGAALTDQRIITLPPYGTR